VYLSQFLTDLAVLFFILTGKIRGFQLRIRHGADTDSKKMIRGLSVPFPNPSWVDEGGMGIMVPMPPESDARV